MTSLNSVLLSGLSSMRASQTALSVTSQNIANANTPGYVRTEVNFAPRSQLGAGAGVEVSSIQRAADRFLATASYIAESSSGAATARAEILNRAQASFGDPTSQSSMFGLLDDFWSAVTEIGVDPSSTLRRDDAVSALQSVYTEVQRVAASVQSLIGEADQGIADAVENVQDLMNQIAKINGEIQLTKRSGADASGAENAQAALIDELSKIVDIRITPIAEGGVSVRTSGGALLVGATAGQISYTPNSAAFANHGVISLNPNTGSNANLEPLISGGELYGLLQVRDNDLVDLAEALGGFAGALGDALNEVHNENSASPPISSLTGRQTGLLATDSVGFTGLAYINIVDSSGDITEQVTIDFDNMTITADGGTPVGFSDAIGTSTTAGTFVAVLNGVLGAASPAGSAQFSNGVLSISTASGGGVVVQQGADPNAADRAGRGFSHFFGLNDLVSRPAPMFFETGLAGSDLHGFASGQIDFEISDSAGRRISTPSLAITGALVGGDVDDLVTALNTTLGSYGSFTHNTATGEITLNSTAGYSVSITGDTTSRGGTGVSFAALFGLDKLATAGRAVETNVNSAIAADPGRLAVARPSLGVGVGERLIEAGDNQGVQALLAAKDAPRSFAAAGSMGAQTTSLSLYASRLGGEAGRLAGDAQRNAEGASAVAVAAADRRAQVEGVSIDDELIKMTQYQNAYAAAARVIQAATEMFDILISMGFR